MSEQRGVNPVLVILGVIAGAASAWFFAKKDNRVKTAKVIATAKKTGKAWVEEVKKSPTKKAVTKKK